MRTQFVTLLWQERLLLFLTLMLPTLSRGFSAPSTSTTSTTSTKTTTDVKNIPAGGGDGIASKQNNENYVQHSSSLSSSEEESSNGNLVQNWWPVTLEAAVQVDKPNPIELLGKTLVLFHDGNNWNCLEDRCSHRFAPLSEGRLVSDEFDDDNKNNNKKLLQCAYHGWEFQGDGCLERVPQQQQQQKARISSSSSSSKVGGGSACAGRVQTYPVRQGGGMIWVWPDADDQDKAGSIPLPVSHLLTEYLEDYSNTGFQRDLPYGYELLAENLLDVSHLPFSHHGTGGFDRDLARPLNLKMVSKSKRKQAAVTEANRSPLFVVSDDDRTKDSSSSSDDDDDEEEEEVQQELAIPLFQGSVQNASQTDPTLVMFAKSRPISENSTSDSAFYAPSHIRYRRVTNGGMGANIELFLCSTGPGKSRAFLFTSIERVLKRTLEESVKEQKNWFGKLKQRFINNRINIVLKPSVAGHMVSHDIFDGDGIFLQKQGDRMNRYDLTEKDYYTPTSADALVLTFRRWLAVAAATTAAAGHEVAAKSATGMGAYGLENDNRSRADMLNRYETHTKNCPLCLAALSKQKLKKKLLIIARTILLGSVGASFTLAPLITGITKRLVATACVSSAGVCLIDRWLKKAEKRIHNFYYVDYIHSER